MALNKVNYVDNQTIITAQNLNDIQNEIIQNTKLIKNVAPRNLLDNSDFQNPVNQLGFKSGTAVESHAGFIDRWRNGGESSITPNLSSNGTQPNGAIFQILDLSAYISKKMTLAAGFSDGSIVIASGTLTEASTEQKLQLIFGTMELGIATQGGMWLAGINYPNRIIQWAALYEGSYTAETLPEYQPKGYAAELRECQRYYYKHKASTALFAGCLFNTGVVRVGYILPVPMIKTPSVDVSSTNFGNIDMYAISKVTTHPTAISVNMFSKDSTFISLALNWSFSATSGTAANVRFNTEFSLIADL